MRCRVILPLLPPERSDLEKIEALQVEFMTLSWAIGRRPIEMLRRKEEIATVLKRHNAEVE